MRMFRRNMSKLRLCRKMPPPSCFGVAESPESGSFRYTQAMNTHATRERAPTTDITGTRPHRQLTGELSQSARLRYGMRIAAIEVTMNDRMNPKMPTRVLNGESGLVVSTETAHVLRTGKINYEWRLPEAFGGRVGAGSARLSPSRASAGRPRRARPQGTGSRPAARRAGGSRARS